jgi:hypothetical protein
LAREVGDWSIIDFIYQYYLKNTTTPEASMSIDLATELVKLARERGDNYTLSYFMSVLLKKLREDRNVNIELTLEVINFAREVGNQYALTEFLKEYLTYLVAPFEHGSMPMSREYRAKHIPTILTIELLKLAVEIDDQQISALLMPYIHQILGKITYIQPNLALEILKFTRKVKDQVVLEDFKSQYIDRMLQTRNLITVELTVELIKSVRGSKKYSRAIIANFYHKNITPERCHFDILSVDTIVDLRELAHLFGDDMLLQKINKRLKL